MLKLNEITSMLICLIIVNQMTLTLPSKQVFSRNAPIHPVKPIMKVIPPGMIYSC